MGDKNFFICRNCQYTSWLEDYELPSFIAEHSGHKIGMIPSDWDSLDEFEEAFRKLMGWKLDEEELTLNFLACGTGGDEAGVTSFTFKVPTDREDLIDEIKKLGGKLRRMQSKTP